MERRPRLSINSEKHNVNGTQILSGTPEPGHYSKPFTLSPTLKRRVKGRWNTFNFNDGVVFNSIQIIPTNEIWGHSRFDDIIKDSEPRTARIFERICSFLDIGSLYCFNEAGENKFGIYNAWKRNISFFTQQRLSNVTITNNKFIESSL